MNDDYRVPWTDRLKVGEGPYWDSTNSRLWWVDLDPGLLYQADLHRGTRSVSEIGPPVTFAIPARGGGFVAGRFHTVERFFVDGTVRVLTDVDKGDPNVRLNDGKCDAAGRLVFGTLNLTRAMGTGDLWSLSPAGKLTHLRDGVSLSNGIDWSPDGRVLYHVDSDAQHVTAFDYDMRTGGISGDRVIIEVAKGDGLPDGLSVDERGNLWLALFGGGAVRCYSPSGELLRVLDLMQLPVTAPTSVAFAGDDLRTMVITTSVVGIPEDLHQPLAGALLLRDSDVAGLPAHEFGG